MSAHGQYGGRQLGLTLIEVMVAMTIGLILLIALGTMLVGSIRHFKIQDDFSRMQENGAYALNAIGNDIRMAGFYGGIGNLSFVAASGAVLVTDPAATDCSLAWAVSVDQPIFGYEKSTPTQAHAALNCIAKANFLDQSPILVLRGAEGEKVAAPGANQLYVQSTAGGGVVFNGTDFPNAMPSPVPTPWKVMPDGITLADIYPYQAHVYYLRPCSRPTGGVCAANDDDGKPIPTLVRQALTEDPATAVQMTEQSIAEGVERISFMYGVDLDPTPDGFPNAYVNATDVNNHTIQGVANASVTWTNVVTVRVAVLVRSTTPAKGYNDNKKSYDLGDGTAAYTCAGTDCSYHRHLFAQTFQARNISQRMQ